MRFKSIALVAIALLGLSFPATAQKVAKSKRPRVAVLEFKAPKNAWSGWGWIMWICLYLRTD